jgi:dTDP-4-amino-4,6-dideoxygalactose transaminase
LIPVSLYAFYFPPLKLPLILLQYLLPKNLLTIKIKSKIEDIYKNFDVILVASGRSAIYDFLNCIKNLEKLKNRNEVLIPNYICNVVDKAVIESNLVPVKYETDEYFRPIKKDICAKISEKTLAIIFAPIFGSYDDVFVQAAELFARTTDAFIVFDNAQCIACKVPPETDAVILSFNNKDIWGVMGGALLIKRGKSRANLKFNPEKLSFREEFSYLVEFFKTVYKILKSPSSASNLNTLHFEHSTCSNFPYTLNKKAISKISLVFALHGLNELQSYEIKREKNYKAFKKWCEMLKVVKIIETKNVSTAPLIPIRVIGNIRDVLLIFDYLGVQVKMPYALDDNPAFSLRKNVIAIPNNPNFDYSKIFRVTPKLYQFSYMEKQV